MQIKVLPAKHNCPTTKLRESKMATQGWIADRLSEWVKHNPSKGAKDAKEKVEQDWHQAEVLQGMVRSETCTRASSW